MWLMDHQTRYPDVHPWAGSLVLINIVNGRNTGHKKLLLRAGIVRKLTLDESKLEQPTLYIAPHHWPISLHRLAQSVTRAIVIH
jgi:hypothetical protein